MEILGIDEDGNIDPAALAEMLADAAEFDDTLFSLIQASQDNNNVG